MDSTKANRPITLFLDHHFGGLNDHGHAVAGLEIHLFGAAAGDDTFDFILADLDDDVRHHVAEFHVFDLTTELIACG